MMGTPAIGRRHVLRGIAAAALLPLTGTAHAQGERAPTPAQTEGPFYPPDWSGDTVKFGAKVSLVDEDTEEESVYQIVGEFEADVKQGKISVASPIARAIIGKRKGDSVEVSTPGGGKSYEITRVRFN